MKITFIIYGLGSGGAERAVSGLANFWATEHEISIITLVKSDPFYKLDPNIKLYHCLNSDKKTTSSLSTIIDGGKRLYKLYFLLRKIRSEVVISFMTKTNYYSILTAKAIGIPCIISERANHELNRLPKSQEKLRNFLYKKIDALVVQTTGNLNYYSKTILKKPIIVIPNAVATVFKRNTQIKENNKIILNVGAFRNGKAQHILLHAFAKLKTTDWSIIFLGQGPNLNKNKELAKKLGLEEKVIFKGAQTDVAAYYNKANIFVFTSEHEGYPNALLEALYFGIPSISTNCKHGPSDMITNGENGFLVPVGDIDALASKMKIIMNNKELQEKFRNASIASTEYNEMDKIATKWMDLIKTVTNSYLIK
ncbi:glycosyltransferase [Maribacter litoralis]|uniref:GalNAc-alpha-(1->4)-GalNAc-alpha-(1->3)-diNAcBac-PP-undecaprenol alpha-1,4-N-acetyl-D-galactosaminyltransferase n=1 Tax=Maribacter litoralis TaxID=2059726 RepID=A0A653VAV0_9FLAO|nr:glycosyltransferase [Maribacter litoralis]VXC03283.1 GalNAc-alpha-(1->4)-GalNAc-alpha-(1->3)-diNAcBac-PP-undecaprenol alpha-1,4-N-acetyl-D-galactosaminyltransferase [Maribacter litoralis]